MRIFPSTKYIGIIIENSEKQRASTKKEKKMCVAVAFLIPFQYIF